MQKIIICDLDGTLLEKNGQLSPKTIEMVQRFHASGGIFIIATGRLDHDIVYIEEKLGIQGKYRISQNGAVIKNECNDIIWNREIDAVAAAAIVKLLHEQSVRVEVSDKTFRYFPSPRDKEEAVEFVDHVIIDPDYVQKIGSTIFPSVILTFGTNEVFEQITKRINKHFRHQVDTIKTSPKTLEILPKGVSKGAAVKKILQAWQLDASICAIGDSANDISMFEMANYAHSISSASVSIQRKADEVFPTVGDCINAFMEK